MTVEKEEFFVFDSKLKKKEKKKRDVVHLQTIQQEEREKEEG